MVFFFSAIASCLILYVLTPLLGRQFLDEPNSRSSHLKPTPVGGGLAFVLVSTCCSLLALKSHPGLSISALPLLAFPLAVIGLLDDRHHLPASLRFGFQVLTAVAMLGFSPLVGSTSFLVGPATWLFLAITIFLLIALTATINFANFMDGLDGLLAGCMAVTIGALSIALAAPWPLFALVGSLFGFLLWNWSPAKVFMGDVGSTFLGAVFAGLVLQAPSWTDAFVYLLVATPLLADACLCIFRRLLAGQPVFQAHRLHLFQRLHQAGWSHPRVSVTYISATLLLAVAALAGSWPWVLALAIAELLFGALLDQRFAVPFSVASKR